jgi:hypothetical protein
MPDSLIQTNLLEQLPAAIDSTITTKIGGVFVSGSSSTVKKLEEAFAAATVDTVYMSHQAEIAVKTGITIALGILAILFATLLICNIRYERKAIPSRRRKEELIEKRIKLSFQMLRKAATLRSFWQDQVIGLKQSLKKERLLTQANISTYDHDTGWSLDYVTPLDPDNVEVEEET